MTLTPDRHLNLRADIKATLISLQSTIQIGGNWRRCASIASDLALKLEELAELEQSNDGPRHRVIEPPPPPDSGDEFLGPTLAAMRREGRRRGMPVPPRKPPRPGPRYTIEEVKEVEPQPPALPDGS